MLSRLSEITVKVAGFVLQEARTADCRAEVYCWSLAQRVFFFQICATLRHVGQWTADIFVCGRSQTAVQLKGSDSGR